MKNISIVLLEYPLISCQLSFHEELVEYDLSAYSVREKLEAKAWEWPSCLTDTSLSGQVALALKGFLIADYSLQVSSKCNTH